MLDLLVFREKLRSFYARFDMFIIPALKFLLAYLTFMNLNSGLGYMKALKNPAVPVVLSLLCCVLPYGGICWIAAGFMLAHLAAVSVEMTVITAAFLLITALLYYGFQPGDSYLLILTPLMFAFRIQYVIPILVGLGGSIVSIVPVSCGVVLYYILMYVTQNAGPLTNESAVDITQKFVQMINGIISNKTMLLMVVAFAAAIIVTSLIRNLSIRYSWTIAIISGIVSLLLTILVGDFMYGISVRIIPLFTGIMISAAAAAVYTFMVFNVAYSRTEYTQFEDDDYYYYVKAVPKIAVSAPAPKVQTMNPRKATKQKQTEESQQ